MICPRCNWEHPANAMWTDDRMCLVCAIDTGLMDADLHEHMEAELVKATLAGDEQQAARLRGAMRLDERERK